MTHLKRWPSVEDDRDRECRTQESDDVPEVQANPFDCGRLQRLFVRFEIAVAERRQRDSVRRIGFLWLAVELEVIDDADSRRDRRKALLQGNYPQVLVS